MRVHVLLIALAMPQVGCGDDTSSPTDGGLPFDTGSESDSGVLSHAATLRFITEDGMPVEGTLVAVDTEVGRFEATSDTSGHVDVVFQAPAGGTYDTTFAKEGFVISSRLHVPVSELGEERVDEVLFPISPALADRRMVTVAVANLPTDGRFCVSFDGWSLCGSEGQASAPFPVPVEYLGVDAHVWVIDDAESVVDFVVGAVTGEGMNRTVNVTNDGTPDVTPVSERDVRIELPSGDAESPLLTADLSPLWPHWFGAVDADTGRFLSVGTGVRRDGTDLVVHVTTFNPSSTTNLFWSATIWTQLADLHSVSWARWEGSDPGDTVEMLGLSRLTAGATLGDAFSWTPPAANLRHVLSFRNNGRARFWAVEPRRSTDVRIPALPTGYDREVSFPFAGASGDVIVTSFVPPEDPDDEPPMRSLSEPYPMTY